MFSLFCCHYVWRNEYTLLQIECASGVGRLPNAMRLEVCPCILFSPSLIFLRRKIIFLHPKSAVFQIFESRSLLWAVRMEKAQNFEVRSISYFLFLDMFITSYDCLSPVTAFRLWSDWFNFAHDFWWTIAISLSLACLSSVLKLEIYTLFLSHLLIKWLWFFGKILIVLFEGFILIWDRIIKIIKLLIWHRMLMMKLPLRNSRGRPTVM